MAGMGGDTAKKGQVLPWVLTVHGLHTAGEFQEAFGLPEAALSTLCSRKPSLPGPGELRSPCFRSHFKGAEQWEPSWWDGAPKAALQKSYSSFQATGLSAWGAETPRMAGQAVPALLLQENIPREYISL